MSRNRGSTTCDCGVDLHSVDGPLLTEDEYLAAIGRPDCPYIVTRAPTFKDNAGHGWGHRDVHFRKIVCPACAVEYVGWLAPSRGLFDEWSLFDTSYWSTFNDKPGEADMRNRRGPTPCTHDRHGKSYASGSWFVSGFTSGSHRCPCGRDGLVRLALSSGDDGLYSETKTAFCVACATALRDGLTCEINAKVPSDSEPRT